MNFAQVLEKNDLAHLRQQVEQMPSSRVERALAASSPGFDQFLALISPAASEYLEPLAQQAHKISLQRFGRVILLYAPLYLSNECTNSCLYCGFNVRRSLPRVTLNREQITAEAGYLRSEGFRHLLLVCGEAPRIMPASHLASILGYLRESFASLALEIYPLSIPDYAQLGEAGADGLTLYQETYCRERYAEVHPAGRKRDFDWRLGAVERAAEGGFRRLGIGALLGLHDWRYEAIALALHADYLMKRFWKTQISISFPRLRHTPEGFQAPQPVSDAEMVQLMLALRIFLPDAGQVLSTREPAHLRDHLIPLGVTQMSAGSRTEPGGYLKPILEGAQFEVEDQRSPAEVANAIRRVNYEPVWKDWDQQMHTLPYAQGEELSHAHHPQWSAQARA